MSILATVKDVRANYAKYDEWEQKQADNKAKKEYLAKNVQIPKDKVQLTRDKAKAVIRATEILDKKSEDNAESTEQFTNTLAGFCMLPLSFAFLPLAMKNPLKSMSPKIKALEILLTAIPTFGFIIWGNKKQKEASRVGRFQARQNELKDVKNFVAYTPEQIEAAKILAKNLPDKKDKKDFAKSFQDMKAISKDKKAYKAWLQEKIKNPDDVEKLLHVNFSETQLNQGKEDKELIVSIVKDINVRAEEYSENVENAFDTLLSLSFVAAVPLTAGVNKLLSCVKSLPQNKRFIIDAIVGAVIPLGVSLGIGVQGTSQQKLASRVGRFKMRQEILKDTNTLLPYKDEDYKKASKIKAPATKKSFFQKITDDFDFLKIYMADKKEYKQYCKTVKKENDKIYEALKSSDISESQMKDAKHLQEKVFFAFDEIDEMSQKYSEDTEAATEIVKEGVSPAIQGLQLSGMALIALLIKKGKFPIHKIVKTISHIVLDKSSSIRGLIDEASSAISKDKDLKHLVCKSVYNSKAREVLLNHELVERLLHGVLQAGVTGFDGHLKKGHIAKWFRNLTKEISKLKYLSQMKKEGKELTKEMKDDMGISLKPKNYKTLILTGIPLVLPVLGTTIAIPFALNAWMTNIQKKAGKIGVMKAVEKMDNPKFFVNKEAAGTTISQDSERKPKTTNLLDSYAS